MVQPVGDRLPGRYKDFIYLGNTGISQTLRVSEWRQCDTSFDGGESDATVRLPGFGVGQITVHGFADHVIGKPVFTLPPGYTPFGTVTTPALDAQYFRQKSDGDDLSRSPVSRYGADIALTRGGWRAPSGVVLFARQTHVAKNEAPSPSSVPVDAHLDYGYAQRTTHWEAFVDASNVTDTEARPYNSFLRDRAPLPGRARSAGLRTAF